MTPARPTIRCLWDDLLPDLGRDGFLESELADGRAGRRLPHPSLRLDGLNHPVLADARNYFGDEFRTLLQTQPPPKNRAFSLGRTKRGQGWGMVWYKARADHLRGLVCLVDGVFWLGWEGDRNTDYATFNTRRHADQHTRHFEPTSDDVNRLRLEDVWAEEEELERSVARWLAGTVLDAWVTQSVQSVAHPETGAALTVEVEEDEGVADIRMTFVLANDADLGSVYTSAAAALPGISAEEWEPRFEEGGLTFHLYTMVEPRFLARLATVREAHGLDALVSDQALAADEQDGYCHLVRGRDHGRGYAEGALIKSVCGHRFVPTRNPDDLPICGVCTTVVHALREAPEHPREP